jgi:hypothetical protein
MNSNARGNAAVKREVFSMIQNYADKNAIRKQCHLLQSFSDILNDGLGQGLKVITDDYAAESKRATVDLELKRRVVDKMHLARKKYLMGYFSHFLDIGKHIECEQKHFLAGVIKTLVRNSRESLLQSYDGMKAHWEGIIGLENGRAGTLKKRMLAMLMDKNFTLMVQGMTSLREWKKIEIKRLEVERLEYEKNQIKRSHVMKIMTNQAYRDMNSTIKHLTYVAEKIRDQEQATLFKQRGICNRIINANIRFMAMGFNKLVEAHTARQAKIREKVKIIIKMLSDQQALYVMMAYNGLKLVRDKSICIGYSRSELLREQLIRRLCDRGYNLGLQAVTSLRTFLRTEREADVRNQTTKDRILRRLMDENLRSSAQAIRMLQYWARQQAESETVKALKLRGMCNKFYSKNARLMS